jgi:hypothetical protein
MPSLSGKSKLPVVHGSRVKPGLHENRHSQVTLGGRGVGIGELPSPHAATSRHAMIASLRTFLSLHQLRLFFFLLSLG